MSAAAWLLCSLWSVRGFCTKAGSPTLRSQQAGQEPAKLGRNICQEDSGCLSMGTHYMCKAPLFTSNSSTYSSNIGFKGKRDISHTGRALFHQDLRRAGILDSTDSGLGPWFQISPVDRKYPPFCMLDTLSSWVNLFPVCVTQDWGKILGLSCCISVKCFNHHAIKFSGLINFTVLEGWTLLQRKSSCLIALS